MITGDNNPKNPHIFGLDMFVPFFGVVEDRNDPLTLGRCKVRIFGVHPDDKTLVTTEQLPWAYPIMPIVGNAGSGGMGHAPVGPVVGTYVFGFFADGLDRQQPFFMGVIAGDGGHFNYGVDQLDANGNPIPGTVLDGPINGLPKGSKDATTRAAGLASVVLKHPTLSQYLKPHHVCALMGNMWIESNGFQAIREYGKGSGPHNVPPPKGTKNTGYGWAQWTNSRLDYFLDYCSKHHVAPDSDEAQLGYFILELTGGVPGVNLKNMLQAFKQGGTHSAPSNPKGPHNLDTIEGATGFFMGYYERPAARVVAESLPKRIKAALATQAGLGKAAVPVRSTAQPTNP